MSGFADKTVLLGLAIVVLLSWTRFASAVHLEGERLEGQEWNTLGRITGFHSVPKCFPFRPRGPHHDVGPGDYPLSRSLRKGQEASDPPAVL